MLLEEKGGVDSRGNIALSGLAFKGPVWSFCQPLVEGEELQQQCERTHITYAYLSSSGELS